MKKMLPRVIAFIIITVVLLASSLKGCIMRQNSEKRLNIEVTKWDNFYEGNNIHFYYMNFNDDIVVDFGKKYRLDKLVNNENDLITALNYLIWLHDKTNIINKIGDNKEAKYIELNSEKKINVSSEEFKSLFTEGIAFLNIYARSGILRTENVIKGNGAYKVFEVWSKKYGKWIMVDVLNENIMERNGQPLSAIDVIYNGIENVNAIDAKKIVSLENETYSYDKKDSKYLSKMEKYFWSYSIPINNNNDNKNVNAYITFIPKGKIPQICTKEGFIPPTVFVNDKSMFNISPLVKYVNNKTDDKITFILSKSKEDSKKGVVSFIGGAFKNSVQVKDYFYSINGHDWINVNENYFFEFDVKPGENTISISKDGKNVERKIVLQNNIRVD
ncbi:hypothetical protein [Clostridium tepidiprofundi]|uniref:hypothetical protein n=1 Tax=Clostridium tepidiprofundi TaxID=420412 RepID=UPI000829D695|nr:hypothetical protein [Clostridium tepidiprofundi]